MLNVRFYFLLNSLSFVVLINTACRRICSINTLDAIIKTDCCHRSQSTANSSGWLAGWKNRPPSSVVPIIQSLFGVFGLNCCLSVCCCCTKRHFSTPQYIFSFPFLPFKQSSDGTRCLCITALAGQCKLRGGQRLKEL